MLTLTRVIHRRRPGNVTALAQVTPMTMGFGNIYIDGCSMGGESSTGGAR